LRAITNIESTGNLASDIVVIKVNAIDLEGAITGVGDEAIGALIQVDL